MRKKAAKKIKKSNLRQVEKGGFDIKEKHHLAMVQDQHALQVELLKHYEDSVSQSQERLKKLQHQKHLGRTEVDGEALDRKIKSIITSIEFIKELYITPLKNKISMQQFYKKGLEDFQVIYKALKQDKKTYKDSSIINKMGQLIDQYKKLTGMMGAFKDGDENVDQVENEICKIVGVATVDELHVKFENLQAFFQQINELKELHAKLQKVDSLNLEGQKTLYQSYLKVFKTVDDTKKLNYWAGSAFLNEAITDKRFYQKQESAYNQLCMKEWRAKDIDSYRDEIIESWRVDPGYIELNQHLQNNELLRQALVRFMQKNIEKIQKINASNFIINNIDDVKIEGLESKIDHISFDIEMGLGVFSRADKLNMSMCHMLQACKSYIKLPTYRAYSLLLLDLIEQTAMNLARLQILFEQSESDVSSINHELDKINALQSKNIQYYKEFSWVISNKKRCLSRAIGLINSPDFEDKRLIADAMYQTKTMKLNKLNDISKLKEQLLKFSELDRLIKIPSHIKAKSQKIASSRLFNSNKVNRLMQAKNKVQRNPHLKKN